MSHKPEVNINDKFEMQKNKLEIFIVKKIWYGVYKVTFNNKLIK